MLVFISKQDTSVRAAVPIVLEGKKNTQVDILKDEDKLLKLEPDNHRNQSRNFVSLHLLYP